MDLLALFVALLTIFAAVVWIWPPRVHDVGRFIGFSVAVNDGESNGVRCRALDVTIPGVWMRWVWLQEDGNVSDDE